MAETQFRDAKGRMLPLTPEAKAAWVALIEETDSFPDDRRTCRQCLNLRGRVSAVATPGGLVSANKGYRPAADTLHRFAAYLPDVDDHDQRLDSERWPLPIKRDLRNR